MDYLELDSGCWAHPNYLQCPCHGGWLLSDYDTFHRCPLHGVGVPHPDEENPHFDYKAHWARVYRESWRCAVSRSGLTATAFRAAVGKRVEGTPTPSRGAWLKAAWEEAEERWEIAMYERARDMGFSNRLEAAWEAEAQVERAARVQGLNPDQYAPQGSVERFDADSWY